MSSCSFNSSICWSYSAWNCVKWNKEEEEFKNLRTCFFIWFYIILSCLILCMSILDWNNKMQLHISPSLRHVTVLPGKGLKEFIKVKVASRRLSYRMLFYSLLFFTFLLRFVFVLTAVDGIDGQNKCSTIGTLPLLSHTYARVHTHIVRSPLVTISRFHRS